MGDQEGSYLLALHSEHELAHSTLARQERPRGGAGHERQGRTRHCLRSTQRQVWRAGPDRVGGPWANRRPPRERDRRRRPRPRRPRGWRGGPTHGRASDRPRRPADRWSRARPLGQAAATRRIDRRTSEEARRAWACLPRSRLPGPILLSRDGRQGNRHHAPDPHRRSPRARGALGQRQDDTRGSDPSPPSTTREAVCPCVCGCWTRPPLTDPPGPRNCPRAGQRRRCSGGQSEQLAEARIPSRGGSRRQPPRRRRRGSLGRRFSQSSLRRLAVPPESHWSQSPQPCALGEH